MLPFSKRKNAGEEIELDDDDLVLVESPPPSFAPSAPLPRLLGRGLEDPRVSARPRRVTASVSRRIIDESVAQDVAGECLSAIAAASREGPSASRVRAAVTQPPPPARSAPPPPLVPSSPPAAPASRLPSVSPPPFVRTTTTSLVRAPAPVTHLATRDSSPPPAFVRRSSPMMAVARAGAGDPGSVAPVSAERSPSPTVIVVRERPKAAWVIGAAAIGAVCAVLASRLVMSPDAPAPSAGAVSPPTLPSVAAPVLPAPPAVAAAPAPVAPSAAPQASVAIMRFGDDQGVAFKAPPRPPAAATTGAPAAPPPPVAAAPAPRPRASAVGPALPDGSLSLGATPTAQPTPARISAPASPAPPAPPPEKKPRVLTPEQQLAEAQLKASMR